MVMLRDELMAEVGGGMEEDATAAAVAIPAPVAGGTAQSARMFLHIFCLRYQQLLFWHMYFVLVCLLLFVYCLCIVCLLFWAMQSQAFRVQSAVRGHGRAPPPGPGHTHHRPRTAGTAARPRGSLAKTSGAPVAPKGVTVL